ncbi:MAG TPA: hypothetical protein VL282_08555 [Tepidisphaeraceae bacterium]|nr:hypothetical protein [Tepidisphaeraceae bacterium]
MDQADIAVSVLGVAWFAFMIPTANRGNRLQLGSLSTSGPQPSLLMALVPNVLLYAVISFALWIVVVKGGGVHARGGHYFQNPWAGRARDTEWEIPFVEYKRLHGFGVRALTAFISLFYLLSLAVFALKETDSGD